jgi:hypothetical protein
MIILNLLLLSFFINRSVVAHDVVKDIFNTFTSTIVNEHNTFQSPSKNYFLRKKIKITFEYYRISRCAKLGKLTNIKVLFRSRHTIDVHGCELQIDNYLKQAEKLEADYIYVPGLSSTCLDSRIAGYAYKCN